MDNMPQQAIGMRLAIVGSRYYTDYSAFVEHVNDYIAAKCADINTLVIISGGARGTDSMAERYARAHGHAFVAFDADWAAHSLAAGPLRNARMAESCTHMLAFMADNSRGTCDVVNKAQKAKKSVTVVNI